MKGRSIVLTISAGGATRRRVWSGQKAISLGTSRRWFLERSAEGVRLRTATKDPVSTEDRSYLFEQAKLESGAQIELEGVVIRLKTVESLPAATRADQGCDGNKFRVYHNARGWTLDSVDLGLAYIGFSEGDPVFRLGRSGSEYVLTVLSSSAIKMITHKAVHELRPSQAVILTAEELAGICIRLGVYDWNFNRPKEVQLVPSMAGRANPWPAIREHALASGSMAAAFLLVSFLWPKTDAPLPEMQVVSIPEITVAKPARLRPAAMSSGASAKVAKTSEPKRSDAAPAFQGNKLQSAMKGLFRGGMTQLLAKSEYAPGADRAANARKLFNSSSPALHSTAPITGPGIGSGTRIAAIGGGGQGSGKGVGYGHGEHANVTGQGRSMIAMDSTGSSVEEGLTKDEVGKVIHRHMSEVRYCYEASMLRFPDLEGKLVLGFTIGASGKVKVAAVRSSTLTDSKLDDCIVRRLSAWKFPNTKGGIDVGVTYPFIFKTLGG